MSRLVVVLLATALGIESFGAGCLPGQTQQRKMLYSHREAIADRLLPGDTAVWVYREVGAPYILNPREPRTYEQEIQSQRHGDVIAIVRVASARGELIEKGTWVRTNVVAQIDQLVQSNLEAPLGDSVGFTFGGGNTRIADVDVTAGSFPQLVPGQRYLVFLVGRPRVTLGSVFHVNDGGVLEHVKSNTGTERSFQTNLIGRKVSDVVEDLMRGK